ncbi:MAG: hypothetical protein WA885_14775 [Phormidesmis sp.]
MVERKLTTGADPFNLTIDELKTQLLRLVAGQDEAPISQRVKLLNQLLPLFDALEQRNPTPDVAQQIPLVQGIWHSVWSTIPFQDILPGRVRQQSYQIFADNGLYANIARYRPGHKQPWLNWVSKWLLSYDLMILQTYSVNRETDLAAQQWDIQNVGIRQVLRFGPTPLSVPVAKAWFQQAIAKYQQSSSAQQSLAMPESVSRTMKKRYQKVAEARPQLEHLYIDQDFRLVKTLREKNQRPSYTIAVRLPDA